MMEIIAVMSIYVLQCLTYVCGSYILFNVKMRRKGLFWGLGAIVCFFMILTARTSKECEAIYLMAYLVSVVVNVCAIMDKWHKKVSVILSVFCISACLDEIIGTVLKHFANFFHEYIYNILEGLLTIVMFIIFKKAKKWFLLKYKNVLSGIRKAIVPIVVGLCICQSVSIFGLFYAKDFISNGKLKLLFQVISVIGLLSIPIIVLFIIYVRDTNRKMEQLLVKECELKEMQERYYKVLLEKESDTRKYRHDMNDHLLCLSEMAENEKIGELKEYICEIREGFSLLQRKGYATGNDIMNILLNYYLSEREDVHISVSGQCTKEFSLNKMEVCTIISNIIKNAVEEIERLQTETEKYIKVKIVQRKQCIVITVKNSSQLIKTQGIEEVKTVKIDKKNHGIGLKNIMETVQRNGGSFILTGDGKEAVAELILPCN